MAEVICTKCSTPNVLSTSASGDPGRCRVCGCKLVSPSSQPTVSGQSPTRNGGRVLGGSTRDPFTNPVPGPILVEPVAPPEPMPLPKAPLSQSVGRVLVVALSLAALVLCGLIINEILKPPAKTRWQWAESVDELYQGGDVYALSLLSLGEFENKFLKHDTYEKVEEAVWSAKEMQTWPSHLRLSALYPKKRKDGRDDSQFGSLWRRRCGIALKGNLSALSRMSFSSDAIQKLEFSPDSTLRKFLDPKRLSNPLFEDADLEVDGDYVLFDESQQIARLWFELPWDTAKLRELRHAQGCTMEVTVHFQDGSTISKHFRFNLHPRNKVDLDYPWCLGFAALVDEEATFVRDLVKKTTIGKNSPEQDLCYLWGRLVESGVSYHSMPGLDEMAQSVRGPKEVWDDKQGNCVELTVLLSTLLSAHGHETWLFCPPGHSLLMLRAGEEQVPVECTRVDEEPPKDFQCKLWEVEEGDEFGHKLCYTLELALEEGEKQWATFSKDFKQFEVPFSEESKLPPDWHKILPSKEALTTRIIPISWARKIGVNPLAADDADLQPPAK